jgi:hypothetical protein
MSGLCACSVETLIEGNRMKTLLPDWPCNIDRTGHSKMPDGIIGTYKIKKDEIVRESSNHPSGDKLLYLQKVRHLHDNSIELRFGYYIIGKKEGRTKGKWVWGQFAPFIRLNDFQAIIEEARQRGWIEAT